MRLILALLLIVSCNTPNNNEELVKKNQILQKENDSLKTELNKCDMLIRVYEDDSLSL